MYHCDKLHGPRRVHFARAGDIAFWADKVFFSTLRTSNRLRVLHRGVCAHQAVNRVPIFSPLSMEQKRLVSNALLEVHFRPGLYICEEVSLVLHGSCSGAAGRPMGARAFVRLSVGVAIFLSAGQKTQEMIDKRTKEVPVNWLSNPVWI